MAGKKRVQNNLPSLLVARGEARKKIKERVSIGIKLKNRPIGTLRGLEKAGSEETRWNKYNTELLLRIFDGRAIADEYSHFAGAVVPMDPPLLWKIKRYREDLAESINRLESILERLDLIPEKTPENYEETKPFIGRTIRIFVSYSSKDKKIAGGLKELLEKYGFDVFLAHEDIRPSAEWQKVIMQNLDAVDIFVPICSTQFKKSEWTDQESGYALAKGKKIIPVAINGSKPYGFIGSIQAVVCNIKDFEKDISSLAAKLIKEISTDPKYEEAYYDGIIRSFKNSYSFVNAGDLSSILLKATSLNKEQINEIVKASLENPQIKHSFKARPKVKSIIEKFKDSVEKDLLKRFNDEYNPQEKNTGEKKDEEENPF